MGHRRMRRPSGDLLSYAGGRALVIESALNGSVTSRYVLSAGQWRCHGVFSASEAWSGEPVHVCSSTPWQCLWRLTPAVIDNHRAVIALLTHSATVTYKSRPPLL